MATNEQLKEATCTVCPRHCKLTQGQRGVCGARIADGGRVVSENYGKLTAVALDPIEKKPLSRFHPGSLILSAGSYGCNMTCPFCQNHNISQERPKHYKEVSPEQLVEEALTFRDRGNIGIAFTYNEPGVGYEFVRDTAKLAKKQGLKTVMVTNAYLSEQTIQEVLPHIDAFNVDLKAFNEEAYKKLGGDLNVVKRNLATIAKSAHLEVTTLVVPGLSDSEKEMEAEAAWLARLSPDIVLHISRFFPQWKTEGEPTSLETMQRLSRIAQHYLQYVLLGNV